MKIKKFNEIDEVNETFVDPDILGITTTQGRRVGTRNPATNSR